jgi:hypothetical protein
MGRNRAEVHLETAANKFIRREYRKGWEVKGLS